MKIHSKIASAILLCLLALTTLGAAETTERHEVDKIVAIVNDEVITRSALDKEITSFTKSFKHDKQQLPPKHIIEEKLLERLVYKSIQLQIAHRANISASDEDVNKAITRIADANNITPEQLKFSLTREGIDFKEYKEDLKKQVIINKMQTQAIQNKIKISEEEIDKLLKTENETGGSATEYHIKHHLVEVSEKPTPEQWQAAKQIAMTYSTPETNNKSKSSKLDFEDYGWKKASELPILFTTQLAKMKKNEVSPPLRAPNGYHIIKLIASKNQGKQITRDEVSNILYRQKFEKELMEWLEKMKKGSYVKIML